MTRPRRTYEYPDGAALSIDGRLRFAATTYTPPGLVARPRVRRWRLSEVDVAGSYRDEAGEAEVWARSEVATHPWPWCLYVHVDGTTARLYADDTVHLHDPDGGFIGVAAVFAALRDDPRARRYVVGTSAGQLWDSYPKGFFAALGDRLCFVLRTFWGSHVIVDARSGARVAEAPWMAEALRAAAEAWALARLQRAVRAGGEVPFYSRFAAQDVRDVVAAVQLAGQLGLTGAAGLVQALRLGDPTYLCDTRRMDSPYRGGPGELDIRSYTSSLGRRAVQLALLRLGREPGAQAAYLFLASMWHGRLHDPGPRPADWAEALREVRPGLHPRALLACAGAPLHVHGDTWDYDVLAGGARTMRVRWDRRGVRDVQVVAPPEWVAGYARDGLW